MPTSIVFHKKLQAQARKAAKPVKDPILREVAYHSILRHLYERRPTRTRAISANQSLSQETKP